MTVFGMKELKKLQKKCTKCSELKEGEIPVLSKMAYLWFVCSYKVRKESFARRKHLLEKNATYSCRTTKNKKRSFSKPFE